MLLWLDGKGGRPGCVETYRALVSAPDVDTIEVPSRTPPFLTCPL